MGMGMQSYILTVSSSPKLLPIINGRTSRKNSPSPPVRNRNQNRLLRAKTSMSKSEARKTVAKSGSLKERRKILKRGAEKWRAKYQSKSFAWKPVERLELENA